MTPRTIWDEINDWLSRLPLALAYRIIWLTALLGSRTAQAVLREMWDAGIAVPCPKGRDPDEPWEPRFTAQQWREQGDQA